MLSSNKLHNITSFNLYENKDTYTSHLLEMFYVLSVFLSVFLFISVDLLEK